MFAKWFGSRPPRSSAQEYRFRPQLEYLEGRLAPSSMGMSGDDNDNGNGTDNGDGNDHNNVHINDHDNFHINEHNAFNVVLDTLTVNQSFGVLGTSQAVLAEQLFASLGQALVTTPGATVTDALNLVVQEFQLGQQVGMLVSGILSNPTANQGQLLSTISGLESGIQLNPLEASAAGQVAGSLAFDIGLNAALPQLQHHS